MIDKIEVNGQVEDIVNKVLKYVCIYGVGGDYNLSCTIEIPLMLDKEETITSLSQLYEKMKHWEINLGIYDFYIPAEGKYDKNQITGIFVSANSDNTSWSIMARVWLPDDSNKWKRITVLQDTEVQKIITQEL